MTTPEIQHYIDIYPALKYNNDTKKVICSLTKHEMPATVAAIESYVKGRKFKNASMRQMYDYEQHKPFIVPSTKKKHQHELFCMLTLRHISKTPQDVKRHLEGKRFQRALTRWQKCQETGVKFVPRGGRRPSSKTATSDSDDANGHNWSDYSDDEKINDNDDMSDLYPVEDFEDSDDDADGSDVDNDSGEDDLTENLPPANVTATADADSDYDMSALDCDNNEAEKHKLSSADIAEASLTGSKSSKKKKIKKRKRSAQQTNGPTKSKKMHFT